MSKEQVRILIAAGGTGGHVFPALAIADEMKKMKPNTQLRFVGTKGKIETQVIPQRGYSLEFIWISGFHRTLRFENVLFPIKVIVSLMQSFLLIKKFRPDVVMGTGGYVCGPVLYVASLLRIPTVVHESNSYPGVTTRLLSTRATCIMTAFDATAQWLKRKDNIALTGTPTREVLGTISREDGLRFFHLDQEKKTVLVFGGSLGATSINQAMKMIVRDAANVQFQVIWQTGKTDEKLLNEMKSLSNCWINTFIDNIEYAYAAADIVVCRAGATTLAELTRLGKAAILIPYPYAAADHQTYNARTLADAGGAVMIADHEVQSRLKDVLNELIQDKKRLQQIRETCQKYGKPNAGSEIVKIIFSLVN